MDPDARAEELNAFFHDPQVRGVVVTIGGFTTNGVLDLLDWESLRRDPKVLIGYSDLTALLLATVAQARLVCFHGPTLLPELAEFPAPLSYTADHLRRAVTEVRPLGRLVPPSATTEEFLAWDEADDRPRTQRPAPQWRWLREGSGRGPLLGGNLETIGVLAGTRYLPDLTGAVLVWETTSSSLGLVERSLAHLQALGALDGLAGMVVGRSFRAGAAFEAELHTHLLRRFRGRGYPVLVGVDLGHTDPMLTLPLGAAALLDSGTSLFEVVEPGVG